jgi:hypothetical protein
MPVEASGIDAVVLMHAHLDHIPSAPGTAGFRGLSTPRRHTNLAEHILRDSARFQEQDAAFLNKVKATKHSPALALYGEADAQFALRQFVTGLSVNRLLLRATPRSPTAAPVTVRSAPGSQRNSRHSCIDAAHRVKCADQSPCSAMSESLFASSCMRSAAACW